MNKPETQSDTRRLILAAALKHFANAGYAATSIQQIVDEAKVSKPALYYYFADKTDLYRALVDHAHEERFRLMQEAAQRGATVAGKLEEVVATLFEFALQNQALMRLAFATAFTMPGDGPIHSQCVEKGRRNYEFVRALIQQGQDSGELDRSFNTDQLAMGIYGQLNSYVMVQLILKGQTTLDRETAQGIVRLFLQGAAARDR